MLKGQIYALQLKKGVSKGELTFMVIIKLEPLDVEATHELTVATNVLKEFIDLMLLELLKTLLPCRGIDYRIKLK